MRMRSVQYVCAPPYSRLTECSAVCALAGLPAGTIILAVQPPIEVVQEIGHSCPTALLVVGLQPGQALASSELDSYRRSGVTGLLVGSTSGPSLAQILSVARMSSEVTSGALAIRLRLLGRSIPPAFEAAIDSLVGNGETWTANDWAAAVGESVRNIERRCAKEWRVPGPRRWLELIRAIRAVQALQREANGSVEFALLRRGFSDAQSTRRLLRRVCDASPTEVRTLIGWYFVLERWCINSWSPDHGPARRNQADNVAPLAEIRVATVALQLNCVSIDTRSAP